MILETSSAGSLIISESGGEKGTVKLLQDKQVSGKRLKGRKTISLMVNEEDHSLVLLYRFILLLLMCICGAEGGEGVRAFKPLGLKLQGNC